MAVSLFPLSLPSRPNPVPHCACAAAHLRLRCAGDAGGAEQGWIKAAVSSCSMEARVGSRAVLCHVPAAGTAPHWALLLLCCTFQKIAVAACGRHCCWGSGPITRSPPDSASGSLPKSAVFLELQVQLAELPPRPRALVSSHPHHCVALHCAVLGVCLLSFVAVFALLVVVAEAHPHGAAVLEGAASPFP